MNDDLVKDEIVSVANGNIQKFEVVSEVQIPEGGFATSLKATVSVSKLTTFVESKGIQVEFKGSLFSFNVNQQILNEKNENKAIADLCQVLSELSDAAFDYAINVSDPVAVNGDNTNWRIPMYVSVSANENLLNLANYFYKTLKGLSLTIEEANNYKKLGKSIYPVSLAANENEYDYFILRSESSIKQLLKQLYYFNHSILNFNIDNGLSTWKIKDSPANLKYIYDGGFRIFLKIEPIGRRENFCKSSLFYTICNRLRPNNYLGTKLELQDYTGSLRSNNCKFNDIIILDYTKWFDNKFSYNHYGTSVPVAGIENFPAFNTGTGNEIVDEYGIKGSYFSDQFAFANNNLNKIIDGRSGLVISFVGIKPRNEIVRFYCEEVKSLAEINKITGYKVGSIKK